MKLKFSIFAERNCGLSNLSFSLDKNLKDLKQKVNLKCQDGWIPEGSFSIVEHGYSKYLCQTMIRPIVESNEKESNQKVADRAYINLEYDGEE